MASTKKVVSLLPIGSRVRSSCEIHGYINAPGTIRGYVNKRIYPTGHGEYAIEFDGQGHPGLYGCDAEDTTLIESETSEAVNG